MVQLALFLVSLFKRPIQWFGVDYPQFTILLRTKLTIDFRSAPSSFQASGKTRQTFQSQLFIYIIFGAFIGYISYTIDDIMLSMIIFHTITMVMLATTLISDFTTVLFDHRDNQIILFRPVSNRTFLFLRLIHIQFYMGYIALALALGTGVIIAIKYNFIALILFLISVGLGTWITLVSTTVIYMLISKTVEKERFKDIITFVQILIVILIFAGYQFMPKLISFDILHKTSLSVYWWTYLLPPAWLAAIVNLSQISEITNPLLFLSFPGIVVPVAGAGLLIRFLSEGFEDILAEGNSETVSPANGRKKRTKGNIISKLFCSSEIEQAGWAMTVSSIKRDRKFKQSVYPYLGMMMVIAIIFLNPEFKNSTETVQELSGFSKYFLLIIAGFSGSVAVSQLPYTDTPEAAWIYSVLPIKAHGHILTGAVKSMFARFFLPLYLVVSILSMWFWGINFLPQIVLCALCILLLTLLTIALRKMELPFTQLREMQSNGTNTIMAFLSMILMGLMAAFINAISIYPIWITLLLCIPVVGLIFLIFNNLRRRKYLFRCPVTN